MTRAIQCTEVGKSWDEAYTMLRGLSKQEGYLGGRVFLNHDRKWTAQAFVDDNPHAGNMWLPDGCKRVVVPQGLAARLGF